MSTVTPYAAGVPSLRPFDPPEPLRCHYLRKCRCKPRSSASLLTAMSCCLQAFQSPVRDVQTIGQVGVLRDTCGCTVSRNLPLGAVYVTCKWSYLVSLSQVLSIPLSQIQGNYSLEREASEPDLHIVDLNSELTKCEGHLSTAMEEREHACVSLDTLLGLWPYISSPSSGFAFEGIGQLLEHLLISEAKIILPKSANGIRKMTRSILALQQGIKTFTSDIRGFTSDIRGADFDRAKEYYALFFRAPMVCFLCRERVPTFVC